MSIKKRLNAVWFRTGIILVFAALFLLPIVLMCGCALLSASEDFYETYAVDDGTALEVYNHNGKVDITGWDRDYVEISAVKESFWGAFLLDQVEIQVEIDDKMVVETEYQNIAARLSVNYEIKVPEGVSVSAAKSSNGSISLENVSGNAAAATSNGKITIYDVDGTVTARSSNGNIEISEVNSIAGAETSNGSIFADLPSLYNDLDIKTSNGSISLNIIPGLDADIEAKTSNGKVSVSNLEFNIIELEERYLRGKMGDGAYRLNLKTSNGSIELDRL